MSDLQVPFALDQNGILTSPLNADEERKPFLCPACRSKVTLKRGVVRVAHFAHEPDTACTSESIEHITAKYLLVGHLAPLAGTATPRVMAYSRCQGWVKEGVAQSCDVVVEMVLTLPPFSRAQMEVVHQDYRLDVALTGENGVVAALEVYHAHLVDEPKEEGLDVPWWEVTAATILENPARWALLHPAFQCWTCREAELRHAFKCRLTEEKQGFEAKEAALLADFEGWNTARTGELRERAYETAIKLRDAEVENAQLRARVGALDREKAWREKLPTLRFAVGYLRKYSIDLKAATQNNYFAKRCSRCNKPLLLVDTTEWVENWKALRPLLIYFRPPDGYRGFLVNVCPYCDTRQKKADLYTKSVEVGGHELESFLQENPIGRAEKG